MLDKSVPVLDQIRTILRRLDAFGIMRLGSALSAISAGGIALGFLLSIVLAGNLGVEGFGVYVFALTLAQFLCMFVLAGLPLLVTRQVAIYRGTKNWALLTGFVRWSFGFVCVTYLASTAAARLFYGWRAQLIEADGQSLIYLSSIALALPLAFMHLSAAILRGFDSVFVAAIPDSLIRPMALVVGVVLLSALTDLTPLLAMGAHVAAGALAMFFAACYARRHCRLFAKFPTLQTIRLKNRAWLASLLPMSLIAGAAMINSRVDVLMLGTFASKTDVAVYSLAAQMAGLILLGQTIVNTIIGPRIARLHATGQHTQLQRLVSHACRMSAVSSIAALLVIAALGPAAIHMLVGSDFAPSHSVCLILAVGYIFSASMGPVALILNMTNHAQVAARIIAATAGLNVIFNLALVPHFQAYGAAAATVVTLILSQSLLAVSVRKQTTLRPGIFA